MRRDQPCERKERDGNKPDYPCHAAVMDYFSFDCPNRSARYLVFLSELVRESSLFLV